MIAHASLTQMMGGDKNVLFGDRIGCECLRRANQPLEIKGSSVPHPCGKERRDGLRCISAVDQFTTPEDGFGTITSLTRIHECRVDFVQRIQMTGEHHRGALSITSDDSQFYDRHTQHACWVRYALTCCAYAAYPLKKSRPSYQEWNPPMHMRSFQGYG